MKLGEAFLGDLRRHLAKLTTTETLQVEAADMYFGPNPHTIRPAIVCRLVARGALPPSEPVVRAMTVLLTDDQIPVEALTHIAELEAIVEWAARLPAALMQQWSGLLYEGGASGAESGDAMILWISHHDKSTAVVALRVAVSALAMLLDGGRPAEEGLRSAIADLRQMFAARQASPETQLMIRAAAASNIPMLPTSSSPSMWQFGWGVRSELFWVTSSNRDGLVGNQISRMKHFQKKLFGELGLPTPRWRLLSRAPDVASALEHVGFPCVIKPTNQSSGRGVTANITNRDMLKAAIALARPFSSLLIMEAHQPGHDHRLLIINGRLEMALRLDPPTVRGDGRRTVSQLIGDLNRQRAADKTPGKPSQVPTESLDVTLMGQQLTDESIPAVGREVLLRSNANRATGGTAKNVLHDVHPSIRRYAELLAEAAGFQTLGIDYVTEDISKSHEEVGGGFLEINATPGMARVIAEGLVPPDFANLVIGSRPGRIPVSMLIAPAPRLDEMARKLAGHLAETAAMTGGDWARLGSVSLPRGTRRPIDRVTALLRYRSTTSLQILWTPEEFCQWGLPVDLIDCALLLDASLDQSWRDVLADRAGEVLSPRSNAEAVRLLKRWARAGNVVGEHGSAPDLAGRRKVAS